MPDASSPPVAQTSAPVGALPGAPPEALLLPFAAYQRLMNYLAGKPWVEVRGLMDELIKLAPAASSGPGTGLGPEAAP